MIGEACVVIRTLRGLDRKTVAEKAGVSYAYYSAIEAYAKEPGLGIIRRIADTLGVSPADLLALSDALDSTDRDILIGRLIG